MVAARAGRSYSSWRTRKVAVLAHADALKMQDAAACDTQAYEARPSRRELRTPGLEALGASGDLLPTQAVYAQFDHQRQRALLAAVLAILQLDTRYLMFAAEVDA